MGRSRSPIDVPRGGGHRPAGRPATMNAMDLAPIVRAAGGLSAVQRARYSRQILLNGFGEEAQLRLLASRVLVVGAGGLGSPALLYLAAAGVGAIGIVDDDAVALSNLHRQVIHDSSGVGAAKTACAAAHIRALNPDVTVVEHRERLTEANVRRIMEGYDVVLDGADNFPTRYVVDAACSDLSVPEVWGSVLRYAAQVCVFWTGPRARAAGVPDPGVCLRDLFPSPPPPGSAPACDQAGVIGPLCGQAGAIMAGEAVKLITGVGAPLLGRVLVMDMLEPRCETVPLAADPNRPAPLRGEALSDECPARPAVPEIDVRELAEILGRARPDGDAPHASGAGSGQPWPGAAILLDVREPREREICAIPGSLHIPLAEVLADPAGIADRLSLGGGTVYVHCLGGGRSLKAAQALAASGVHAVNVAGGIKAWWTQIDPSMPRY